jgi:hypothetical protein
MAQSGWLPANDEQMNWGDFVSRMEFLGYRAGHYLTVSFIDDPAWLAFVFC